MGIILEKMFSFFEWLYIADSVPGLVWLILGAAVVVLGVVALNESEFSIRTTKYSNTKKFFCT